MQAQAPRPNIVQGTPAEFPAIRSSPVIHKNDLETRALLNFGSILQAAAQQFDRLSRLAGIGMANNVGESFIDGAGQAPALIGGEAQFLRQPHHGAAYDAQDFGIAGQLKPEEPAGAVQFEALPSRVYKANSPNRNKEHTRSEPIWEQ